MCRRLLDALSALQVADDQAIFEVVSACVEPLPVFRHTLQIWAESLPASAMRDSAMDVLLVLHPEHLCSRVSGRSAGDVPALGSFVPTIQPALALPQADNAAVLWLGHLCPSWAASWGVAVRAPARLPWPFSGADIPASVGAPL